MALCRTGWLTQRMRSLAALQTLTFSFPAGMLGHYLASQLAQTSK